MSRKPPASIRSTTLLRALEAVQAVELVPYGLQLRRHVEAGRKSSLSLRHDLRFGGQDVDRRQVVPLADLEIVEIVGGRDLDRA